MARYGCRARRILRSGSIEILERQSAGAGIVGAGDARNFVVAGIGTGRRRSERRVGIFPPHARIADPAAGLRSPRLGRGLRGIGEGRVRAGDRVGPAGARRGAGAAARAGPPVDRIRHEADHAEQPGQDGLRRHAGVFPHEPGDPDRRGRPGSRGSDRCRVCPGRPLAATGDRVSGRGAFAAATPAVRRVAVKSDSLCSVGGRAGCGSRRQLYAPMSGNHRAVGRDVRNTGQIRTMVQGRDGGPGVQP